MPASAFNASGSERAPYLYPTSDRSLQVLHAKINWAALLKNTALNQP